MSDDNKDQEPDIELVSKVSEYVSTDTISDLKTGIYNLFVNLINNLVVYEGVDGAVLHATKFLDEISNKFKQVIEQQEK